MASIFPNQSSPFYGDLSKVSDDFFDHLQKRFGDTGEQFRKTFVNLEDVLKRTQAKLSRLELSKQVLSAGHDLLKAQQNYLKGLKEEGLLLDKNSKKIFDNSVKTRADSAKKLSNLKKERDYIQTQMKSLDQSKIDKSSAGYKNLKQSFNDHLKRISAEKKATTDSFHDSQNQVKIISKKKLDNAKIIAKAENQHNVLEGGVALAATDNKQLQMKAAQEKIQNSLAKSIGLPDIAGMTKGTRDVVGSLGEAGILGEEALGSVEAILTVLEAWVLPIAAIVGLFSLGISQMVELDKAAGKFRMTTGLIGENANVFTGDRWGKDFNDIQYKLAYLNVSVEDVGKTSEEVVKTFGMQAVAVKDLIPQVLKLNKTLGISDETTLGFYKNIMSSSGGSKEIATVWLGVLTTLANTKGSMVSLNAIMHDIANASGRTVAAFRGNTTEMIKSALAAQRYGSNLESVADSAYAIMDFQKTITADQTVSALTGKNINFDKFNMATSQGNGQESMKQLTSMIDQMGGFVNQSLYTQQAFSEATGKSVNDLVNIDRTNNLIKDTGDGGAAYNSMLESQMSVADKLVNTVQADRDALSKAKGDPSSTADQIKSLQDKLSQDANAALKDQVDSRSLAEEAEGAKNKVFTTLANITLPLFQTMLPYLQDLYAWFTSDYTDIIKRVTTSGMSSNADFNELLHHGTAEDLTKSRANTDPKIWQDIQKANSYSLSNIDAWTGGVGVAQKKIGDSDQESSLLDLMNKNNGNVDKSAYLGNRPKTYGGRHSHLDWDDKSDMFDKTLEIYKSMHPTTGTGNNVTPADGSSPQLPSPDITAPPSDMEHLNRRGVDALPPTPSGTETKKDSDVETTSSTGEKMPLLIDNLNDTQAKTNLVLNKLLEQINGGISIYLDSKKVSSGLTSAANNKAPV